MKLIRSKLFDQPNVVKTFNRKKWRQMQSRLFEAIIKFQFLLCRKITQK